MERARNRPPSSADEAPFGDEALLQGYIARLMNMQDERETWLEADDLRQAARDLGLTDEDLARVQATVAAHRQRGRRFAERGLWDEAQEAFRQANALAPFDAGLTHELAQAYLGRWRSTGDEADRLGAERYAHRTLELDPEHHASYEILRELKRRPVRSTPPSGAEVRLSKTLLLAGVVGLAVLVVALLLFVVL